MCIYIYIYIYITNVLEEEPLEKIPLSDTETVTWLLFY